MVSNRPRPNTADRLARVIREIPRRRFFPNGIDQATQDDQAVPIGEGRFIPPVPLIEMMLRALDLDGTERVLDIGCGSGYQAALLGGLAREVVSVEGDADLVRRATSTLDSLGRDNVRVVQANLLGGWPESAPYQAIIVVGAASELPTALIDQLDLGGRLVIPLGNCEAQLVERLHKRVDGLDSKTIGTCRLDMLPCSQRPSLFPWASARHAG